MKTLLIDNQTKYVDQWKLFEIEAELNIEVYPFDDLSAVNPDVYDLIILSGGSGLPIPFNRDRLADEMRIIRTANKPLLGICLGFELIVEAFNGKLNYRETRISKFEHIQVRKNDKIFGSLKEFNAKVAHKYYVDILPPDLESLAISESGIEVFKHKTKTIYGFQFHPEIQSDENQGTQIFLNFIDNIKKLP